jgi:glycopeptide antibiotics resistance protein
MLILAVVVLSLWPDPPEVAGFQCSDKVGHLLAYTVLMLWFGSIHQVERNRFRLALCLLAMGLCLEVLQGMNIFRTFQWTDMVANGVGVMSGWYLARTPLSKGVAHLDAWLVHVRQMGG